MTEYKHNLVVTTDEEGRHFTQDGIRVYTKSEVMEVKHIPASSQPMLNGWMRDGKVKIEGYGPVTPGSHNERVYINAMSVDALDYEPNGPKGPNGEEEWSFRLGKATLKASIATLESAALINCEALLEALKEAHSLTEARRVYNQLKKQNKK